MQQAWRDIHVGKHSYSGHCKSSLMTYLSLGNLTKDAFPLKKNLFNESNGQPKTAKNLDLTLPFVQSARIMQVLVLAI